MPDPIVRSPCAGCNGRGEYIPAGSMGTAVPPPHIERPRTPVTCQYCGGSGVTPWTREEVAARIAAILPPNQP